MKVAFFGNVCNNFYQIALALRTHADVDAHLYINSGDHPQMKPESDEPSLARLYPDWIHAGAVHPRRRAPSAVEGRYHRGTEAVRRRRGQLPGAHLRPVHRQGRLCSSSRGAIFR